MSKLPFVLSVPSWGTAVPLELSPYLLVEGQKLIDESYHHEQQALFNLNHVVQHFIVSTALSSLIDVNKEPGDFSPSGIFQHYTVGGDKLYKKSIPIHLKKSLMTQYYMPFHDSLNEALSHRSVLGIDCYYITPQQVSYFSKRQYKHSLFYIADVSGACPWDWLLAYYSILSDITDGLVTIITDAPVTYINKKYGKIIPWMQIHVSNTSLYSLDKKASFLIESLQQWSKWYINWDQHYRFIS